MNRSITSEIHQIGTSPLHRIHSCRTCRRKGILPFMHFYCLTKEIATVYAQSREKNYCTEKNYIEAEATLTKNAGMNAIKKLFL